MVNRRRASVYAHSEMMTKGLSRNNSSILKCFGVF